MMENPMEKNTEHEMENGVRRGYEGLGLSLPF